MENEKKKLVLHYLSLSYLLSSNKKIRNHWKVYETNTIFLIIFEDVLTILFCNTR